MSDWIKKLFTSPTLTQSVSTPEKFGMWFRNRLPGIRYFTADEFLVKGEGHRHNGLNTDPPINLWPNVIPLARLLDELRDRLGKPITLTSVYRSPAYNKAISGSKNSYHMQFKAADFVVHGLGTPADWAWTLKDMRARGRFSGGIGIYDGFVHVDVRGKDVDFDYRNGPRVPGKVL